MLKCPTNKITREGLGRPPAKSFNAAKSEVKVEPKSQQRKVGK